MVNDMLLARMRNAKSLILTGSDESVNDSVMSQQIPVCASS